MSTNESEAYLESIARKSFLSMWSYPNPYYGHVETKKGKELCDLLVIFEKYIILFSDKSCNYPITLDEEIAWRRWYKRSIDKSINQLIGAKKTLERFPERVFTDINLITRFPLKLPPQDSVRIFLIAVTHKSSSMCLCKYGRSSLELDTRLQRDEKILTVGCHINEHFVHILDDTTLEILMKNLDTIKDFTEYLKAKERALSSYDFIVPGEENLLAHYLLNRDENGKHIMPISGEFSIDNLMQVENEKWDKYVDSDQYSWSKEQNRTSYNIDNVIEHFTESFFGGEMVVGQQESIEYHEKALRLLAAESRFSRRVISKALSSIYDEQDLTTTWASTIASPEFKDVRYVFITYPQPTTEMDIDTVEKIMLEYLLRHVLVAQYLFARNNTIIGIAIPNRDCKFKSYCMHILDGSKLTEDDHQEARMLHQCGGIFANLEVEHYFYVE
jgi:hypothetical protein